jgi:MYXO-CTERM domain-containing protein
MVIVAMLSTTSAMAATIGPPVQIGTVTSSSLPEISGIVESRTNSNTLWVHNDSGDPARFFAMSRQGTLLGTFPLASAPSGDWEDIAIGPKSGGGNYLYLGDIGDNNAVRSFITVHRTDEPLSNTGATIPVAGYTSLKLQYPGGARDAESLFVDPLSGDMFIITKRTAIPEIYSVPATAFDIPGQTVTMTALGNLGGPLRTPTAADISPDGRFILVRRSSSSTGYLYERGTGQSVADALHGAGIPFTLGAESQGEAIGWAADGTGFYTTSEMDGLSSAPIYSYVFIAPPALLAGDYNNDHRVDSADYTVWRDQLGANVALPNEDDTPGVVTSEDYDVWLAHFGESMPPPIGVGAGSTAVPEPASWLLAAIALAAIAARRRRR